MNYDNLIDKTDGWVFINQRSFDFILELYPDNLEHSAIIDYVNLFAYDDGFEYRYILHDKDVKDDGSLVKHHWHLYLRYKNNRMMSAVCKDIGLIDTRWIRACDSRKSFLRYLVHYDDSDKYQYPIESITTNIDGLYTSSIWREPRRTKKSNIHKQLKGQDGLELCFNLIDDLFTLRGSKSVPYRLVVRTLMDNGLYTHFVGHQGILYHYYESWKYDR